MRNTSMNARFVSYCENCEPRFRFHGTSPREWKQWRSDLLPLVIASLGKDLPSTSLAPELIAEWEEDGIIKQKLVFNVEPELAATAYLFRPKANDQRYPAILACHGHGPFAKDAVMGVRSSPELAAYIEQNNNDFGLQLAQAGFVTMAIDWRGFGERDERRKPFHWNAVSGSDLCNAHFLRACALGFTLLGMNVHDGRRAIDLLSSQPFVDPARIGVIGLSFGGTMATWLSLCDERIQAVDNVCYSDRFASFGIRDSNWCGSQITPGLFELCDLPDLQGLIAPRPLLVEIGLHDPCFLLEDALSCWREVQRIYTAAGADANLELDLFPGGHKWGGNKSIPFFRRHLGS